MRKRFLVLITVGLCLPTSAEEFTYAQWKQSSEQWKRGFATAVMYELTTVVIPDEKPVYKTTIAYKKCFENGATDELLKTMIDNYVQSNPSAFSEPIISTARKAFAESCSNFLK